MKATIVTSMYNKNNGILDILDKMFFPSLIQNGNKNVEIEDVTEVVTKGTTPTSIGFKFQKEGINFVKIESIDNYGNIMVNKLAHISKECNEKLKKAVRSAIAEL